ncbi:hypothetical protein lerEdw1_015568 [Lerista edwardsae]|nr:hypothetical protein lerEdw1_015568 [Lerista edwardsae]
MMAAAARQGEQLPPPAPRVEPGRSRPSSTAVLTVCYISVIVANLCYISRYVNGRDGGGDPEPSGDAPNPARDPPALPRFDAGDSASYVLPRLEGVKASTGGHCPRNSCVRRRYNSEGKTPGGLKECPAPTPIPCACVGAAPLVGAPVGYKQKVNLVPNKIHVMKTLSLKPPIFGMDPLDVFNYQDRNKDGKLQAIEVVSFDPFTKDWWVTPEDIQEMYAALKADPDGNGVLSLDEFKEVNMQDYFKYMARKKANTSDFVRNSQQAWLYQGKGAHPIIRSIQQRIIHLTHLPTEILERSEYLQVVRYDQGGYYHAHMDSSSVNPDIGCRHTAVFGASPLHSSCRYATILLYLNNVTGGGETTFPIADNSTYDYMVGHMQEVELVPNKIHLMKTLSLKPLAFEIPDFLSDDECKLLIHLAEREGLQKSPIRFSKERADFLEKLAVKQMEMFNFLDINQDGQLQMIEMLSHERLANDQLLTPEEVQEMYTALKADPDGNGVLSLDEFKRVNMQDFYKYMDRKKANKRDLVRNSQLVWLDKGKGAHPIIRSLQQRVIHLTHLPAEIVEYSEPLQVVRYDQGGHYHVHWDSGMVVPEIAGLHSGQLFDINPYDFSSRYVTVLFYLNNVNGGGETTFPVADNRTYDYMVCMDKAEESKNIRLFSNISKIKIQETRILVFLFGCYLRENPAKNACECESEF